MTNIHQCTAGFTIIYWQRCCL